MHKINHYYPRKFYRGESFPDYSSIKSIVQEYWNDYKTTFGSLGPTEKFTYHDEPIKYIRNDRVHPSFRETTVAIWRVRRKNWFTPIRRKLRKIFKYIIQNYY